MYYMSIMVGFYPFGATKPRWEQKKKIVMQ